MLIRVQCDHPTEGNIVITEIQLYDRAGQLWYTDKVNYSLAVKFTALCGVPTVSTVPGDGVRFTIPPARVCIANLSGYCTASSTHCLRA